MDDLPNELDGRELERSIRGTYRTLLTASAAEIPFETGRQFAERLGYPPADLDRVPAGSVETFSGVGYHHDLAGITPGDHVLELASGSGTDAFVAARRTGPTGRVTGIDMTDAQLTRARRLGERNGFDTVSFERGYIEELPFENDSMDSVLANGAITLSARKEFVFREARRVLTPYGRLTASDIVSEEALPDHVRADPDRWVSYTGGAAQETAYVDAIEDAGLEVIVLDENPSYEFRTERARKLCREYGLKSVSFTARKR